MNGTYRNYDNMYYGGGYQHSGPYGNHGHGPMTPPIKREPTPMEKWLMETALYAIVIGLLVPLVEALAAWLCYALYKDHPREDESGSWGGYGAASHGQSGGVGGVRPAAGQTRAAGFQPFQGGGARLGSG